jgi:glucose-1-phosphate adenylyltransferase
MFRCTAIILGGGAGTRLYPLTKQRAKPAVPIGGAYRLIDVPMSNCINSGISKIYILTQFNSTSLNRHLARTYNMGSGVRFGGEGFVEVLAATQVRGRATSVNAKTHYVAQAFATRKAMQQWAVQ